MEIPTQFTNAISNTFYDKTITTYGKGEVVIDDEGWAGVDKENTTSTFSGNVRFNDLAQLQEDQGIVDSIDIAITTSADVAVGSILSYDSVLYKVIKAIPYDSHNLIIGKKWLSKSSVLPSA